MGAPYGEGGSVGFGIVDLRLRCAVFCTAVGELLGVRWADCCLPLGGVLSAARGVLGDTVCVVMVLCVLAFNNKGVFGLK